ncbi:LacI family DNA-binding transcriptional regulator [Saccharopolyspora shandongensis]|uniref:LacI family DNA-binding transcriptional regulator n=1 Tax=Saccharopolyspora shandongensis TaxID=418495 RepID=UPI0033E5A102
MQPSDSSEPARVTSADVARLAGVSRATVSFVLNDTAAGRVSEATCAKVRAAAAELGYIGHAPARSLRAGRSNLVVIPTFDAAIGGLMSAWLDGFQTALSGHGYTVVVHASRADDPVAAARSWAELRPAAVFVVQGERLTQAAVDLLRRAGTGPLFALSSTPVPGAHTVILDSTLPGALAVGHLADRGRRRIAVVMPTEPGLDDLAGSRLAGARRAAATHGVEVTPVPMSYRIDDAEKVAARLRADGHDAVYGYNDDYAALLLRALLDQGSAVPDEVAVVGTDDVLIAELLRPRLTSVHFDQVPADQLAGLIHQQILEPETTLEAPSVATMRLVVRDSS